MSELLPKDGEFRSLMLFFDGRTARNLLSNIKDELPSFNSKQSKDEKRVRVVSEIQESIQRNG